MAAPSLVCPKCSARLRRAADNGLRCPRCGSEPVPPPGPSRAALVIGLAAAGFLLLAGAAVVVVLALAPRKDQPDTLADANPRETARADGDGRPPREADVTPPAPPEPERREPPDAPPPTSLSEAEQKEVNEAIARGVAYLKKHTPKPPMGNLPKSGLHPLVGLTLLECGVPPDDPVVAGLTRAIRADAPRLSKTYSLSLAILFLDRLGEAQDEPLIRQLAARLIAGQDAAGGWTYGCPALSESDGQLLLAYLDSNPAPGASRAQPDDSAQPRVIRPGEPSRVAPAESPAPGRVVTRESLPNVLRNLPVVTRDARDKIPAGAGSDNSNTQFATLGVWTARRHGVAVDRPLALISARFHQTQNADGTWGYNLRTTTHRDSMTCAGLLGLAVGRAGDGPHEATDKDPAIAKGLQFLGKKVQHPGGVSKPRLPRAGALNIGADSGGDLYWLWSVERVGVIYSLPTMGGKDWYAWGAEVLVAHQRADGSWFGGQGPDVDTCLALLFLNRVNVAKDLTRQLQRVGPIRDPSPAGDAK